MAITALKDGKVIAIPTETVYGLAVDFTNIKAINKLFKLKNRSLNKPLTAFCYSIEQIKDLCMELPDTFYLLSEKFMPGAISIILNKKMKVPDIVTSNKPTIAVRIPNNNFVLSLLKKFGNPLATSSANLSNQSSSNNIDNVVNVFQDKIQYYFDGGISKFQRESTIIDLTKPIPRIIRKGIIEKKDLEAILNMKIK